MSKTFNKDVLSSFFEEVLDYRGKTPKKLNSDWTDKGYRAISANNVKTNGLQKLDSIRYVDQTTYDKWMKIEIERGDLLLTSEAPAGEVMIWDSDEKIVLSQRLFGLRVNDRVYNKYLKYYLQSDLGQKEILRNTSGSTVFGISAKMFDLINVHYPEKKAQILIGDLLSDLDAKIEVNNKINAALEALAKTIYDYWFVQFDFPCPEALEGQEHLAGKPYKSSGGKMVYNEELKREIPEGWEVKELNELLEVGKEQVNPASNPEKEFKHISIPVFDSTETYGIEKGNEIASSKFVVTEYDIAVSKLNPWFNRVFYPLDEQDLICTTEMVVWKCKEIKKKNFFFELAKSQHFIAYSTQNATGTSNSHKRVNPTIMMKYKLPYSKEQIEKFGDLVNPWIKKVMSNKKENQKLAALRDWLLPMLMNGQVTVEKKEDQEVDLNLAGESAGTFKTK
jgi:type I restriction enzyme S subunit